MEKYSMAVLRVSGRVRSQSVEVKQAGAVGLNRLVIFKYNFCVYLMN